MGAFMRRALPFALLLAGAFTMPSGLAAAFREQARLEASYRQALAAWSLGDDAGALAQLLALDQGAAAGSRQATLLARAKLAVGRAVSHHDPTALLAAATLEQRAYDDYARRRPQLAAEARHTVTVLVETHVSARRLRRASGADAGAGVEVDAALLAALGGDLEARAQQTAAADIYGRALALAPRQPAALLGLAAIHEQRGEYGAAADLLTVLAAANPRGATPGAREARLRLAINQLRLGRVAAGEDALQDLAFEGVDWVRSLAAQELARLLGARGDYAAAGKVLAAAAAVLPCDPSLPVQAALTAERAGSPSPLDISVLDLATVGACGEAAESARGRYTHAPSSEMGPLRASLDAAEPEWRRALAAALGVSSRSRVGE